MLEILLSIVATLFLAKHTPRRRYSLRRVRITPGDALGTLGSATAVIEALTGASVSAYRLVTAKGAWTVTGLVAGEGPIVVGYAHSDYTVVEIKECIESQASIDPGEKIAQERANRLVRIVGSLTGQAQNLNDGKPIKTRLNWLIATGDFVNMFSYNDGSSALTTGATVRMNGDIWVKDSA